jgi:hypothetical protein
MLALQQQLHRIEEWKLAELRESLAGLEASQRDLVGALNEDDALQGLFIDALARRLRSLAEEAARVNREAEAQAARLTEHAARKLCAERLVATVDRQTERAIANKELLDIIERLSRPAAGAQASRKIAER